MSMQKEYVGAGSIKALSNVLAALGPRSVFLVTGGASYTRSGAAAEVEQALRGTATVYLSDVKGTVDLDAVVRGVEQFNAHAPDMVIAVGGGSVIDMAKSVNALSANPGDARAFVTGTKKLEHKGKPLIAVPTTSGSGSEATHFAVVYVDGLKYSLAHSTLLPDYAIVDPALTYSLSPSQTAISGIDAFCQAIESHWSQSATEESRGYAREAVKLILAHLREAVLRPTPESRTAMATAAHLAGKAINISKTTASHAMSYPLTSRFGVPHGQAVAITLPQLTLFNKDEGVTKLLGVHDAREAAALVEALVKDVGLATRLGELSITEKDLPLLVKEMSLERVSNNPKPFTKEDAAVLLRGIL